jgi:hypothetical protein
MGETPIFAIQAEPKNDHFQSAGTTMRQPRSFDSLRDLIESSTFFLNVSATAVR